MFIAKYILCQQCNLPEATIFTEGKPVLLKQKCRACGKSSKLDQTHKVANYIVKNPPKDMSEITGEVLKDQKKGKKEKKEKSKKTKEGEEEVKKEKKQKKDGSKKKDKKAKEEVQPYPVTHKNPLVEAQLTELTSVFRDKRASGELTVEIACKTIDEAFAKIPEAQHDIKLFLGFRSLISNEILKEFPLAVQIIKRLVAEDSSNGFRHFLSCIVWYYVKWCPEMQKSIATVLNKSIEQEIVSKDQILLWSEKKIKLDKASSLYFRKKEKAFKELASEFFNWLRDDDESDSNSSDEESGSDEEDVETEEAKALRLKQNELIEKQKQELVAAAEKLKIEEANKVKESSGVLDNIKSDDDSDVDIDNI